MKKTLFIHDGPRWRDKKGNQYGTAADIDMFARYKYLGDKVEFVMRVVPITDQLTLINLNDYGLHINSIIPFNRPGLLKNYFKSKTEIINQVDSADIIVVRLPSTIGSVALKYAKKINKPYIVEVVACPWDALSHHSFLGRLYAPFSKNKLKRLVSDAPYVIYVTKYFLQNRYPTKYHSTNISNVVLRNIPTKNLKEISYRVFDFNKKIELTTLGVVNLDYKGHKYVLKGMATLISEGYDVNYNIIGGGDKRNLLDLVKKLGLTKMVNFTGKLPHDEVFRVLDSTDLYIQPSETEGLPRALIEAMSRGCACISSDAGGMPELLDERVIFESKNVNDLVLKIKYLLDKSNLMEQSKLNFEKAKDYRFEVLEKKRHDFYNKFLASINEK
ncbi:glycosyltransferase [Xanthomarina sp. F1114]|uniref:glycosyltransferase n=1 Tax=Xanthomarina sp. F1114 TaxID=2996019 RepID=UPI00225DDEE6|nr:glycosyltransferase [Xanthomarina sp. F1114]MCX7548865.1 glycosyltransferase [Xanthomarina sp. F1114]